MDTFIYNYRLDHKGSVINLSKNLLYVISRNDFMTVRFVTKGVNNFLYSIRVNIL